MATRADVRSDVSGLLGADANLSSAEINTLIQLRLDHLYETVRWSRRVKEFSLTTVAQTSSTSATTEIYTLSLHDALPISRTSGPAGAGSRY